MPVTGIKPVNYSNNTTIAKAGGIFNDACSKIKNIWSNFLGLFKSKETPNLSAKFVTTLGTPPPPPYEEPVTPPPPPYQEPTIKDRQKAVVERTYHKLAGKYSDELICSAIDQLTEENPAILGLEGIFVWLVESKCKNAVFMQSEYKRLKRELGGCEPEWLRSQQAFERAINERSSLRSRAVSSVSHGSVSNSVAPPVAPAARSPD